MKELGLQEVNIKTDSVCLVLSFKSYTLCGWATGVSKDREFKGVTGIWSAAPIINNNHTLRRVQ